MSETVRLSSLLDLSVVPDVVRQLLAQSTDAGTVRALTPQCDAVAALIDCLSSTHAATRAATLQTLANVLETHREDNKTDATPFRALLLALDVVARAADAILFGAEDHALNNAAAHSDDEQQAAACAAVAVGACVRLFVALTRSEAHAGDDGAECVLLHSMRMLAARVWPVCGALSFLLRTPHLAAVFVAGDGLAMLADAVADPLLVDAAVKYQALYELTVLSGRGERECEAVCRAPDVVRVCARLLDTAANDVKTQKCVLRLLHNVVQCKEHEIDVVRSGAVDALLRLLAQPQPPASSLHVLPALILASISTVQWLRARLLAHPAAIEALVRLLSAGAARETATAARRAALSLLVSVACAYNARQALLDLGIVPALRVALDAVSVRDSFLESHADMTQTELRVLLSRAVKHFELDIEVFDDGPDEPFFIRPRQTGAAVRERLRHEMLDEELRYVELLSSAIEDFHQPLQRAAVISADELATLFSDLPVLLRVHQNWAMQLSDAVRAWPNGARSFGALMRDLARSMHIYATYVNNYGRANALHERLVSTNAAYRDLLAQCAQQRGSKGRTLMAHLIQPLQRAERCVGLLVEYCNSTPPENAEHADARAALDAMRAVAATLASALRAHDAMARVAEVQEQLVGADQQLFAPGREYLAEGAVARIDSGAAALGAARDYYLFLFNDLLLCTKPQRRNRFKVKLSVRLIEATLTARDGCAFEVRTKSERVVFAAADDEAHARWLDLMRNAMRDVRLSAFSQALRDGSVSQE
jgi:hypothetical protein